MKAIDAGKAGLIRHEVSLLMYRKEFKYAKEDRIFGYRRRPKLVS